MAAFPMATARGETMNTVPVTLSVNGVERTLTLEPRQVLLDVLRDELGLRGTKQVCTMGNCGACTVHLDGRAVYSCLVLGVECEGREVTTIEGLAGNPGDAGEPADALHPVQRAFVDCDAYQCGFCTPGQIMSLAALVDGAADDDTNGDGRDAAPDDAAILRATSGNLCRCGAYRNILKAGRQAADAIADGASAPSSNTAKETAHGTR